MTNRERTEGELGNSNGLKRGPDGAEPGNSANNALKESGDKIISAGNST